MDRKIQKPEDWENQDSESFDISWVITADSESVHYDKEYKSYLREMYEKREDPDVHRGKVNNYEKS